jgi:hypothetical protein
MIAWLPGSITGTIERIDPGTMTIKAGGELYKADCATVVPAQKAGAIAAKAGLTDAAGWCPIKPETMQSAMDDDIRLVGDAAIASVMPKSGFAADSQAKVAADAIRGALTGARVSPARYANTCWSLIAPNYDVKVGATYQPGPEKIEATHNFISQTGESAELRKQTYAESLGWYAGIPQDIFG